MIWYKYKIQNTRYGYGYIPYQMLPPAPLENYRRAGGGGKKLNLI